MGCASTSKATTEKSDSAKKFEIPEGKGVVYLYRPGRYVGAAVSTQISVNGKGAGGTGPGTFFRWELKPGTYVFSANTDESSAAAEIEVQSGKMYFLRQDERLGLSSGRVTIKEVDEATGKEAVGYCKLLISTFQPE